MTLKKTHKQIVEIPYINGQYSEDLLFYPDNMSLDFCGVHYSYPGNDTTCNCWDPDNIIDFMVDKQIQEELAWQVRYPVE